MGDESNQEEMKNYILNEGEGPLKEEIRRRCQELETCKSELENLRNQQTTSTSSNDPPPINVENSQNDRRDDTQQHITIVEETNEIKTAHLESLKREPAYLELVTALLEEKIARLAEKITSLEEKITFLEREIPALVKAYTLSLERLWDGNFPEITFIANCTATGSYTSQYPAVEVAGVLTIPNSITIPPQKLSECSTFALFFFENHWECQYQSESDICDRVKLLLNDILRSLDLLGSIHITSEATFGGTRSDVWFLKTAEGIPFLPIEIKKPKYRKQKQQPPKRVEEEKNEEEKDDDDDDDEKESLMSHEKVIGQCCHDMQQLRSSFGQQVVYGIISNLEHWRILRLHDVPTDSTTPPLSSSSSTFSTTDTPSTSTSMTVTASKIYSLHRKEDLKCLLHDISNSIDLSYKSAYAPVPLISPDRSYMIFQDDAFHWGNLTPSVLNNHPNITFNVPEPSDQLSITILRNFNGGADGHAYLGLTQHFDLVVVKKFILDEDQPFTYDHELKYWLQINEKAAVPLGITKTTLVLPFAFNCEKDQDDNRYFDFNLNKLGSVTKNFIEDSRLTTLSNLFQECYDKNPITPKNALKIAVEKFARNNCVHEDIEWRHVALLPHISIENNVEIPSLLPILIDLSRVKEVTDYQTAMNEMSKKIKRLIRILHNESKTTSTTEHIPSKNLEKRTRAQYSEQQTGVEAKEAKEDDNEEEKEENQRLFKKKKATGSE